MTDWTHIQERRWSRPGWLALFLVFSLSLSASPTWAQLNTTQKTWLQSVLTITNGKPVTNSGALMRFVIVTSTGDGETRNASCSASRIGKGIFLTARHCLAPLERKGAKPARTLTSPDAPASISEWDHSAFPLPAEIRGAYVMNGFKVLRAYTLDLTNRDIAVLVTSEDDSEDAADLDILPVRELAFNSKAGQACTVLKGYGFHGTETPQWGYFCRADQMGLRNDFYFFSAKEAPLRCELPPDQLSLSQEGDSGGPLTQSNANGREEVVGVFSTLYKESGSTRLQSKIDSLVGVQALLRLATQARAQLVVPSTAPEPQSPDADSLQSVEDPTRD